MPTNATATPDAFERENARRKTIIARVLVEHATDHYETLYRVLLADEPDLAEAREQLDQIGTLLFIVLEELQELEQGKIR